MKSMYLDHLISSMQEKYSYLIQSKHVQGHWFLFDIVEGPPHQLMWTGRFAGAMKFPNEQAVEEVRAEYVSPRRVEIIRLDNKNNSVAESPTIIII